MWNNRNRIDGVCTGNNSSYRLRRGKSIRSYRETVSFFAQTFLTFEIEEEQNAYVSVVFVHSTPDECQRRNRSSASVCFFLFCSRTRRMDNTRIQVTHVPGAARRPEWKWRRPDTAARNSRWRRTRRAAWPWGASPGTTTGRVSGRGSVPAARRARTSLCSTARGSSRRRARCKCATPPPGSRSGRGRVSCWPCRSRPRRSRGTPLKHATKDGRSNVSGGTRNETVVNETVVYTRAFVNYGTRRQNAIHRNRLSVCHVRRRRVKLMANRSKISGETRGKSATESFRLRARWSRPRVAQTISVKKLMTIKCVLEDDDNISKINDIVRKDRPLSIRMKRLTFFAQSFERD